MAKDASLPNLRGLSPATINSVAALSVPLILCIFPVIIIVIMLPVYVRVKLAL